MLIFHKRRLKQFRRQYFLLKHCTPVSDLLKSGSDWNANVKLNCIRSHNRILRDWIAFRNIMKFTVPNASIYNQTNDEKSEKIQNYLVLEVLWTRKWVSQQSHCDVTSQRFVTRGAILSDLGPFSMHLLVEAAIAAFIWRIAQTNELSFAFALQHKKGLRWMSETYCAFLHSVICFIYANSKAYKEFEIDLHAQLYSIGLKSFARVSHWSH